MRMYHIGADEAPAIPVGPVVSADEAKHRERTARLQGFGLGAGAVVILGLLYVGLKEAHRGRV